MREGRLRADKDFLRHEQDIDFPRSKCDDPERPTQRFFDYRHYMGDHALTLKTP